MTMAALCSSMERWNGSVVLEWPGGGIGKDSLLDFRPCLAAGKETLAVGSTGGWTSISPGQCCSSFRRGPFLVTGGVVQGTAGRRP